MTDDAPTLLTLPDGRRLEILVRGPADGQVLLYHFGTPSAAAAFEAAVAAATERNLRMVLMSRPGYGRSDPQPGRSVADVVPDVEAVLDHVGADQFVTLGWSGGGPHALACARLLPDRCLAAGLIAGVAPFDADGLDWLDGMGPENHEEFGAAFAGIDDLTEYLEDQADVLGRITADEVAEALGGLISEVDTASLTGEFADFLATSFHRSVMHGVAGWRDDDLAFIRPWGFDLDIAPPVAVWQGDQDRMVPFAHGLWLAAHVTSAREHLLPGEGHLSLLVDTFPDILDDLVALAADAT